MNSNGYMKLLQQPKAYQAKVELVIPKYTQLDQVSPLKVVLIDFQKAVRLSFLRGIQPFIIQFNNVVRYA